MYPLLRIRKHPMKKTFNISHPKIKPSRMYESVKSDIRKYIKRERGKELPEDVDFWDFVCRFGHTAEEAEEVHHSELTKCVDSAEGKAWTSFYVEIFSKPGYRANKEMNKEQKQFEKKEKERDENVSSVWGNFKKK
jgi:hypothetical protein